MGVKATNGMGLKSAQAWVAQPMLHKMSIHRHKVSSHPFPLLLCTCVYVKNQFWKIADRHKCAKLLADFFPTPPLSLCSGGG
jgi:hypothetical protein